MPKLLKMPPPVQPEAHEISLTAFPLRKVIPEDEQEPEIERWLHYADLVLRKPLDKKAS